MAARSWSINDKRGQAYPLMTRMVELGWICVSINYSRSPRNAWPSHIVDVKRAIAWVRENIAEFGGDPDFIAVTGGSAGAHLGQAKRPPAWVQRLRVYRAQGRGPVSLAPTWVLVYWALERPQASLGQAWPERARRTSVRAARRRPAATRWAATTTRGVWPPASLAAAAFLTAAWGAAS